MKRTLPTTFVELQNTCHIDPEEQAELLRFIDEFEQVQEEFVQTQGYGYVWTKQSEEMLWQRLNTAMLKATYIPKNTQELLDLPSQLNVNSFDPLDAYDPVYQICWCIRHHQERYFPQSSSRSVVVKKLGFILSGIAELMYCEHRSCLSIDEMKESHLSHLTMRSKSTLARCIALFLELGFLQGTPLQGATSQSKFSRQVDYEFAPLFDMLRAIQRHMRVEEASIL